MPPAREALILCAVLTCWSLASRPARAEPYLAVQMGLHCAQCHINPTGGGERTAFGEIFAQTILPARHLDTGDDTWTGAVNRFLSIGGDGRYDAILTTAPQQSSTDAFDLEQMRVYATISAIPDRLLAYVDEQVAPGGAINREAYALLWSSSHEFYLKAGQMYLPFGLRIQDQSAFIYQASGISMTTPDQGVEGGWLRGPWDAQVALSNGTAGGPEVDHGKQVSTQLSYVESRWRLGAAANFNDTALGNKTIGALFAGLKTGPIAWLAQAEWVNDQSIADSGGRQIATLLEGNWLIRQGHNLKITDEFLRPNDKVANNAETRWSVVYEYTPIQFLQLRAIVRLNDGIPQDDAEHQRLYELQLHGFF